MIRALLDTNVLVSGLVGARSATSAPGEVVRAWLDRRFTLVASNHILDELARALAKPYFAARVTPEQAAGLVELVQRRADIVAVTVPVQRIAAHPEDDRVVAAALAGNAAYLVTGDAELLTVRRAGPVVIVRPADFFAALQ